MPLSSVVGAQSIVRPGVCTSSTRPASPYDGQVIYETDTDKTLVYNGTGWVFLSTSRANPVGLDLVKTQTIGSAVSSVEVTGAFSTTYDNYKIIVSGGASSADCDLRIKMGATTTGYYTALTGALLSGGTAGVSSRNNTVGYFDWIGTGSTDGLYMDTTVLSPFLSKRTWANASLLAYNALYWSASYLANTTSYTDFTITPSTGTLTGGTIRVYGYVNS